MQVLWSQSIVGINTTLPCVANMHNMYALSVQMFVLKLSIRSIGGSLHFFNLITLIVIS